MSSVFRVVFIVLTVILFLGFLSAAISGAVVLSSTNLLQLALSTVFEGYDSEDENLRDFTTFLLGIADRMTTYEIAISAILATLCLISLIVACCNWNKCLKAYTGILVVLLIAQIILVAVVFSNPTKYANGIVSSTEALLKSYGDEGAEGNTSTHTWNTLMKTAPNCCGMDSYNDFVKLGKKLPTYCCTIMTRVCDAAAAEKADVMGCRQKLELISTAKSTISLYFFIAIVVMQAFLVMLMLLLIRTSKNDEA